MDIPHNLSNIYHRTSGSLLAPFHPLEFNFNTDHYLAFIGRFGIHLSSTLGITNDFSPFHFNITSYQHDSLPSCSTSSNLSKYYTPNSSCHLSFRGFSLLLGGDELIGFSPWRTYGEGFHVDCAPHHILRNIPNMEGSMVPFSTMIPLGYDYTDYPPDDLPHRTVDINHPHNKVNVVFGNLLFMAGDTIHQDTTNSGDARGLHPSLIGYISSSKVDAYLSKCSETTPPIDPIELTPINTLSLDIHQIKNFISSQKRQLLDFLKCATPHIDALRIKSEDPDNLQSSAEFRECYDFLHHTHEYLFPFELSLSREYFHELTLSSPSITQTHHYLSNKLQPPKKFDSIQLISPKPNLPVSDPVLASGRFPIIDCGSQLISPQPNVSFSDPVLASGRVPFIDCGSMTYIRGIEPELLTDPYFLQYFDRPQLHWELYDVSGNGNCGYYVHQCHLEFNKLYPPTTVTQFRKELYQFALNQFQQFKSPNEWWTYFGYEKDETKPKKLERLTDSTDRIKKAIKHRLIGRENFDNGCSKSQHMTQWENWLLFHRFKYDIITFDNNLALFTHIHYDKQNMLRTHAYYIKADVKLLSSWSDSIVQKLAHNPKSVMFRRFIQYNSSSGSRTIGHFQWLKPNLLPTGSLEQPENQLLTPNSLKRSSAYMEF